MKQTYLKTMPDALRGLAGHFITQAAAHTKRANDSNETTDKLMHHKEAGLLLNIAIRYLDEAQAVNRATRGPA